MALVSPYARLKIIKSVYTLQHSSGSVSGTYHPSPHIQGGKFKESFTPDHMYSTVLRLKSIQDITCGDITIPKGTVFILNIWVCNTYASPSLYQTQTYGPIQTCSDRRGDWSTRMLRYLRMCTGFLLANRELYYVFMRTLDSVQIEPSEHVDWHSIQGNSDPTSLVAIPQRYWVQICAQENGIDKLEIQRSPGIVLTIQSVWSNSDTEGSGVGTEWWGEGQKAKREGVNVHSGLINV
ncbi:cytochrome P450 [Penicillium taxi]|uniref:cytochrome P450 n=1 Tax=Penicillium taxi TaxID=168475 RepID=UPI0025451887|nr:cytochrome P450 [Penicillium taxi]KAJ5909164.1 cytochrome P450 [Penicillium taxi]